LIRNNSENYFEFDSTRTNHIDDSEEENNTKCDKKSDRKNRPLKRDIHEMFDAMESKLVSSLKRK
jgi:hypothetical protein